MTRIATLLTAAAASLAAATAAAQEPQMSVRAAIGVTPEGLTCVLGGISDGRLVAAEAVATRMRPGEAYALVALDEVRGGAVSVGEPVPEPAGEECADAYQQDLAGAANLMDRLQVAVAGSAVDVQRMLPNHLEVLPLDDGEAADVVRRFVAGLGIDEPEVVLKQVVRTDLDGDGTAERLINAVNTRYENARKGEYSVLLVTGDDAIRQPLAIRAEVTAEDSDGPSLLWENTVVAVLDLDRDGVMGIVLHGAYAFGDGWDVIHAELGEVQRLLSCGCGG